MAKQFVKVHEYKVAMLRISSGGVTTLEESTKRLLGASIFEIVKAISLAVWYFLSIA